MFGCKVKYFELVSFDRSKHQTKQNKNNARRERERERERERKEPSVKVRRERKMSKKEAFGP